jgi:hypothetical protein
MQTRKARRAHTASPTKRGRPAVRKVARAISSPRPGEDSSSKGMLLGYARVSTIDQNLALQRDALAEAGCGRIFTEQLSGAVTDRPALHEALEFARSGDTLIVWKLDRLARSMKQLIETIEESRLARIARSRSDFLKHSAPGAVDRCGNSLGCAQVRCEITASVAVAGGMGKRR